MSKQKPSIPKGTRDFGPAEMAKRNFIFDHIREVYRKYGFQQLETPSMENLSVLTGKYGDEGDKLLFRILESGDFFQPVKEKLPEITEISYISDFFYEFIKSILSYILKNQTQNINIIESKIKLWASNLDTSEIVQSSGSLIHTRKDIINLQQRYLTENASKISASLNSLANNIIIQNDYEIEEKVDFYSRQYKNTDINKELIPNFIENYLLKLNTEKIESSQLVEDISKKGLRYDLTVPFARYVVMNQSDITFPFRRFQIQPVWRADRPQKGRYREFYQCDADVVGTDSLICEAEIVLMIEEVFERLGVKDISIKINNRKILEGIVEAVGAQGKETDLLVAIDKLDKIGQDKVVAELRERGFEEQALTKLMPLFSLKGNNKEQLKTMQSMVSESEVGLQGVREMEEVMERVSLMGSEASQLEFDITLARGLSYYTGAIFEVKANNTSFSSSISGGGRYDNLTGVFGMPDMSGVGISFGVDRIYDVMEELDLFPVESLRGTQVLLISFDEETSKHALTLLSKLRNTGISAEIYPDQVKLKKQFAYADKKGIPYTLVIGTEEIQKQAYGLKNLKSGEQERLGIEEIISRLKQ